MSKITKEEALEMLNSHALSHFHDIDEPFVFPIFDKVVNSMTYVENGNYAFAQYSFRYLICVAYDLNDNG
jgi:hypothetical protein